MSEKNADREQIVDPVAKTGTTNSPSGLAVRPVTRRLLFPLTLLLLLIFLFRRGFAAGRVSLKREKNILKIKIKIIIL